MSTQLDDAEDGASYTMDGMTRRLRGCADMKAIHIFRGSLRNMWVLLLFRSADRERRKMRLYSRIRHDKRKSPVEKMGGGRYNNE